MQVERLLSMGWKPHTTATRATIPPAPTPTVYTCATYCDHAVSMGCDFAQDTPGGSGCVAVCLNVRAKLVQWDLECRSTAPTCEKINACERAGLDY